MLSAVLRMRQANGDSNGRIGRMVEIATFCGIAKGRRYHWGRLGAESKRPNRYHPVFALLGAGR